MFAEYRELIDHLKADGKQTRFLALYDKHADLDREIAEKSRHDTGAARVEIDALKREKLRVKDEIYAFLRDYDASAAPSQ